MTDGVVFLNGRFLPAARARVSVFDRGWTYGDGLFETVRAYRGCPFALSEHLERLHRSALALEIPLPPRPWPDLVAELLRRNRLSTSEGWIRIAVTRGPAARGLVPTPGTQPTIAMTCGALDPATAIRQRRGVAAVTLPFGRNGFFAGHKTSNYLDAVMGKVIATRANAFEGLFRGARGAVTEGTSSNVFCVVSGTLRTPPLGAILPGVTRALVLEVAARDGLVVQERRLLRDELIKADEAFLTSSLSEIVPLTYLDGHAIGHGKPGRVTRRLQRLYRGRVRHALRPRGSR